MPVSLTPFTSGCFTIGCVQETTSRPLAPSTRTPIMSKKRPVSWEMCPVLGSTRHLSSSFMPTSFTLTSYAFRFSSTHFCTPEMSSSPETISSRCSIAVSASSLRSQPSFFSRSFIFSEILDIRITSAVDYFLDQVLGLLVDVEEDASDVLADEAQDEQHDAGHESYGEEQRCPAADRYSVSEVVVDVVEAEGEACRREDQPKNNRQPQRPQRVGKYHIQRVSHKLLERVAGAYPAGLVGYVNVSDVAARDSVLDKDVQHDVVL